MTPEEIAKGKNTLGHKVGCMQMGHFIRIEDFTKRILEAGEKNQKKTGRRNTNEDSFKINLLKHRDSINLKLISCKSLLHLAPSAKFTINKKLRT